MAADGGTRYEDLAGFITGLIEGGTLRPGTKAPSLRRISRERGVSLMTALEAYRLLEDRGLLEARPRSGFYVSGVGKFPSAPARSSPPRDAVGVAVSGLVIELLDYATDPTLLPFGCAIPEGGLLQSGRLDRCLARAARLHGAACNLYTAPRGDAGLRRQLASRALRWGLGLTPDDIVVTCGCTEALFLALKAVTRSGDTVAVESPTYFGLLQALEILGLKALELPTDPTGGIEIAALEQVLKAGTVAACLFASSVNNPLGCTPTEDAKREILALLARHQVPLIEDDIYGDIHFGSLRPRPFMALDQDSLTLYCSSMSKTLAPGYRIGWLAGTRHMQKILETKFATTLCGPALPQIALADFLAGGGYDNHLRRLRRVLGSNVMQMRRAVAASFPHGTRITDPAGGFVLWVELPGAADSRLLLDQALSDGICFAPGDVFSAAGRYRNCLRLSCGHPWDERLSQGITRLGDLAAAMC